jgi:hypothetical protein
VSSPSCSERHSSEDASQKRVATTPSITIETARIVVRAECGVDVGWLAAVLRAMKGLS